MSAELQWAVPDYVDSDFTVADPISIPVFSSAFPAVNDEDFFTQEFMQFRVNFEPLPLNTPHDSEGMDPDYSEYFLVAEGPRQDVKGGFVKWTRTYAKVPASYDDFGSYSYPFVGFEGFFSSGNAAPFAITGREVQTHSVDCKIRYDFFKVGPGGTYPVAGDIPSVQATQYLSGTGYQTRFLQDAILVFPATNPSRTEYQSWIANAGSQGWLSATAPATGAGQIIVEDSRLTRWKGNIWQREVRTVLAQ